MYVVLIAKSVQKQIDSLPDPVRERAIERIERLVTDPRPDGVVKLKGYNAQYRIRVGDYRIRYEIDDAKLIVKLLQCKHRKDIYKS